jgi:hypothetical protein
VTSFGCSEAPRALAPLEAVGRFAFCPPQQPLLAGRPHRERLHDGRVDAYLDYILIPMLAVVSGLA